MEFSRVFFLAWFFSSRRRHTRYWRDWSSDVCSSDLSGQAPVPVPGCARGGERLGDGRLDRGRRRQHRPADVHVVEDGQGKIGKGSCREREQIPDVAVSFKKKGTT